MSTQHYDARDILERYVAALNSPDAGIIRDAAALGHSKDIIRFVLRHCIRTVEGADEQDFLRHAYLSLGGFQELCEEERRAVALLAELGVLGSPGIDLHEEQARRIGDLAPPLQALIERLRAEVAVLRQELECLSAQPEGR